MPAIVLAMIVVALIAALFVPAALRRRRRARHFDVKLPAEWTRLLDSNVPLYRQLPPGLRAQLHGHMQVLLREKQFIGCNGLAISDAMRVTIAAQACLLLLNRETDYFGGFSSILVYPESFFVPVVHRDGALETHEEQLRSGESWQRGPVVLSWTDVVHGTTLAGDGHNVVLHEFAHKLDEENGEMDGVPALPDADTQRAWIDVLGREFDLLRLRARNVTDGVLDDYGATSAAEFFAVATEAFFERGAAMSAAHPRLYETLRAYYQVDPASWLPPADD
ncbi:MAG: zinc-dependent peptidase [Proteobacteria bacterium]|jgi:Mlc titration factor MtfA (ptsG expression regulator)|nr:zinc-dependent peptidase [Pseudomonadota bacterium]MBK8958715.1 zinc-dependent peptidase [Pseudomonadota bacterium]